MPLAPQRTCSGSPTCRTLVSKGRCKDCARRREVHRGSRHVRGYDADWTRLRDAFMAEPANRCCVECARRGRQQLATECDHIVPFEGLDDPRRLDRTNLQPLCGACHRAKTAQHDVIWNGEMDRRGACPSLIDGQFSRPSTLSRSNLIRVSDPPRERG